LDGVQGHLFMLLVS